MPTVPLESKEKRFRFTRAGAVPVRLTDKPERPAFSFGLDEEIPEAKAIQDVEMFIGFLRTTEWRGAQLHSGQRSAHDPELRD